MQSWKVNLCSIILYHILYCIYLQSICYISQQKCIHFNWSWAKYNIHTICTLLCITNLYQKTATSHCKANTHIWVPMMVSKLANKECLLSHILSCPCRSVYVTAKADNFICGFVLVLGKPKMVIPTCICKTDMVVQYHYHVLLCPCANTIHPLNRSTLQSVVKSTLSRPNFKWGL